MRYFFLVISLIISLLSQAQILKNIGVIPFVNNYTAEDYKGEKQNFSVIQDDNGFIYVANSDEAVLVYDGAQWSRISVPNTKVISLCHSYDNTIYVGAKNDLGVLEKTTVSGLRFLSFRDQIPDKQRIFGKVWQIDYTPDSTIVFLSSNYLFLYKNKKLKVLDIDSVVSSSDRQSYFLRLFKVYDDLYLSIQYKGIYRFVNDSLVFIPGSEDLWTSMAILPYPPHQLLIYSLYKGFFLFDGKTFKPIHTTIDTFLIRNVYRAIPIKNKYYAFALIRGGVLISDLLFRPIQIIDMKTGLYNDKVQNLVLDRDDNLWLALDNGIASVHLFSPFTVFGDNYGFSRSIKVFNAILTNDTLFVANSDGLFFRKWQNYEDKLKGQNYFINIQGVNFRTFAIRNIDNKVVASGELGLYENYNGKAHFIVKDKSVRNFIQLKSNPNIIIGVSNVLILLKKDKNNNWTFLGNIKGFNYPIRYIAEDKNGVLWGSEEAYGVYKLYFSKGYDSVKKVIVYNKDYGLHGLPDSYKNYVYPLGEDVAFATINGVYKYDNELDSFVPFEKINDAITDKGPINFLYKDFRGNIWFKQQVEGKERKNWELGMLKKTDSGYVMIKQPFYPFRNKIFSFVQLDSSSYLIGSEGGFIHYDSRLNEDWQRPFQAFVRTVKIIEPDSIIFAGYFKQSKDNIPVLPYKFNSLRFVVGAAFYRFPKTLQYSFWLKGYNEDWSPWTSENVKEFSNLPPGSYTFYVKAKNIYGKESIPAAFSFTVKPPWYLTIWAFIGYIILAILFIWAIVYWNTLRLRHQKEYLEEQVRLRTIEIEQQKHEIEVQRDLLAKQNEEIRRKNKDITDSIEYAKRIQTAILPLEENIKQHLPESFIFYRPRDIVSGDFYWFAYHKGKIIIAAVDCTGHGVPGAFMSMIGAEILNTIVLSKGITDAGEILTLQNRYIRSALKQDTSDNQDGMDMALCVIDKEKGIVEFAGAKNPLIYITKDGELKRIRGDRQSIGGFQYEKNFKFTKHQIIIDSPMWFYIFSDGYQDQFGGAERRKFMTKYFYELLHSIYKLPMDEQRKVLEETLDAWMNGNSQTDDILVIGFKL